MPKSGVIKNQWMKLGLGSPSKPNPTFPRYGLQFYADLWHPDQQAIGSLINGTGIATEAPATLSIGNNTINVTTQGTFIVYVRGSGSATSGTATVVGSVVALVSGHNTITVTGTGTITVALNNVIVDKSGNGHLMTVTGAVWGIQGRTFDGGDDLINLNAVLAIGTSVRSFEFWIKSTPNAVTGINTFYGNRNTNSDGYIIHAQATALTFYNAPPATRFDCDCTILDDVWHHVVLVRAGTASNAIYIDGVAQTLTTNTENLSNPNETLNTRIGVQVATTDVRFFKGTMGEVRVYNRALSLGEVLRNRQATKWRYSG